MLVCMGLYMLVIWVIVFGFGVCVGILGFLRFLRILGPRSPWFYNYKFLMIMYVWIINLIVPYIYSLDLLGLSI